MNVLVTGGAGYVGSHAVRELISAGHTAVVLDSLIAGNAQAVPAEIECIVGDIADSDLVRKALREFSIDCVMHFAAHLEVGESMEEPLKYYKNNTCGALSLLQSMHECGVKRFIFSSTAAVYGEPETMPITEDISKKPINVYGHSKLLTEEMCGWLSRQLDFSYVALRYFNACGAHPSGEIGEARQHESHLVPLILQVPLGQRESIKIFGTDYPTPDGTCVRDYIHISDLGQAHVKAMEYLLAGGESTALNLGTGAGYSVRQVIETAREVTGHAIPAEEIARRAGDPPELVAACAKAADTLNWNPTLSDLPTIVETAWRWHKDHPNGYV